VCNNQKILSRPLALKNLCQGNTTRFALNETVWQQHDWSEPKQDLYQQYINHAARIRAENDYVRIAYSGGVDSHTILTAFRDANVAPDEIFFWTFLDSELYQCNTNYEIHRSVIPYINTIQKWFPKVKITNLNFNLEQFKILRSFPVADNNFCVYSAGIRMLPTALALSCFDQLQINGAITLTGADKPRVDRINNEWYAFIIDSAAYDTWGAGVQGFYQGVDPTIHISQCHAIKNLIEQHSLSSRKQILKFQNSTDHNIRSQINQAIGRTEPFDDIVIGGKKTVRQYQDATEYQPKVYLLRRELRKTDQGRNILKLWQDSKTQFQNYTGLLHTHDIGIFGNFYNLNTGKAHTVDQLFPNGWNLED
jgi:hypothetical protein